ncbi:ribokinase [Ktedonospora formicarum]|uniref:Ribokinase n=1 Tax=Ktedonospora formicarum TaxID=2778364 RepID=A0A8J3MP23_9CHLR|nr:ribokinase [Ktedonospora formicarum]GHO43392.1 ribokinase [Ktedonospora formicarum]
MAAKGILVVGSLNMDQVVRVPHLPRMGETLLGGDSLKFEPGGKGANQAVAMARLGAPVMMAGRVGHDTFGERLLSAVENEGIDTKLIVKDKQEASGAAFIFLSREGDNAIVVAAGANMRVGNDEDQYQRIIDALPTVQTLVLQLEIPLDTVTRLIEAAHELEVSVVLNLAPAQSLPREVLRKLSVLVVNETEASHLSGQQVKTVEDARIVATVLHDYGIATVVITLGERGAILVTHDTDNQSRCIYQTAPKVQPVDTTAAGDCFVGALTVALNEGQSAEDALRFAAYASALKVTRFGAQSGLPNREDVLASLNSGH